MNRALLMPSGTPNEDLDFLDGEYVAIRPATLTERRRIGARRRAVVYTFVLRSCAGIHAIVAAAPLARSGLDPKMLTSLVGMYAHRNETGAVLSKSAAVLAVLHRVFPSADALLRTERPTAGPCTGCNCMWQTGGAMGAASAERQAVDGIVRASRERIAA